MPSKKYSSISRSISRTKTPMIRGTTLVAQKPKNRNDGFEDISLLI
jgi:hypothetical protein